MKDSKQALPESLSDLQQWMQQCLIYQGDKPVHASALVESQNLTAEQHIGIYQRSYYSRLLLCMREQFPALCYALGEELFNDFAREYLVDCPSDTYTLYELGRRFPEYLSTTRPDKDSPPAQQELWINFMVDLAHFERQLFVLFDAPGVEQTGYASEDFSDEDISLQPCLVLASYQFAVADYYHAVRRGEKPALPPMRPTHFALLRRDYLTRTLELSQAHAIFLRAMNKGCDVKHALHQVADKLGVSFGQVYESWSDKGGIRSRWFSAGMFVVSSSSDT